MGLDKINDFDIPEGKVGNGRRPSKAIGSRFGTVATILISVSAEHAGVFS